MPCPPIPIPVPSSCPTTCRSGSRPHADQYRLRVTQTKGDHIIYLNGSSDTWSATVPRSDQVDAWFFLPGTDHRAARIKNLSPPEQARMDPGTGRLARHGDRIIIYQPLFLLPRNPIPPMSTSLPEIGKVVMNTPAYSRLEEVGCSAQISWMTTPIHLNEDYAANSIFQQRVAHGMFTGSMFSRIFGSIYPGRAAST